MSRLRDTLNSTELTNYYNLNTEEVLEALLLFLFWKSLFVFHVCLKFPPGGLFKISVSKFVIKFSFNLAEDNSEDCYNSNTIQAQELRLLCLSGSLQSSAMLSLESPPSGFFKISRR